MTRGSEGRGRGCKHSARGRSSRASRAGDGSVASDGRPKTAMMAGKCVCSACGVASDNAEWQCHAMNKRSNREEPYDDKRKACWRRYVAGFATYLTWEEYAASVGDLANEIAEVDRNLAGAPRNFFREGVSEKISYGIEVERNYQILSSSEFKKVMGSVPHSRMPKVPAVFIQKETPDDADPWEKVYVFQHPVLPHRTMKVTTKHECEKGTQYMSPDQHTHQKQSNRTLHSCTDRRAKMSLDYTLLQPHVVVPDLAQYEVDFRSQREKVQARKANRNRAGDGGEEEGDEVASCELVDENSDDIEAPAVPLAAPSLVAAAPLSPTARPFKQRKLSPSSPAMATVIAPNSSKKSDRQVMKGDVARGSTIGNLDEVMSTCESDAGKTVISSKGSKPQGNPDYYVEALSLRSVIEGAKTGVQEHHAKELLKKLADNDPNKIRLEMQLALVEDARKLSPENIISVRDLAQLNTLMKNILIKHDIAPPLALQEHLLQIHMDDALSKLESSKAAMEHIFTICNPVPSKGDSPIGSFDVFAPKVSALDTTDAEKHKRFAQAIFRQTLIPFIRGGEGRSESARLLVETFLSMLGRVIDQDDDDTPLPEETLQLLLTVADTFKGIRGILSDDLQVTLDNLDAMQTLSGYIGKTHKSWVCTVANEVARSEWYNARLQKVLKNECVASAASSGISNFKDFVETEWDTADLPTRCDKLAGFCKDLSTWSTTIEFEGFDKFKKEVYTRIEAVLEDAQERLAEKNMGTQACLSLQQSLLEMSYAYPQEGLIDTVLRSLAKYAVASKHEASLQDVLDKGAFLQDQAYDGKGCKRTIPAELTKACDVASGLIFESSDPGAATVMGYAKKAESISWESDGVKHGMAWESLARSLVGLLPKGMSSGQAAPALDRLKAYWSLRSALGDFEKAGPESEFLLALSSTNLVAMSCLRGLQRALATAEESLPEEACDAKEKMSSLIERGGNYITKAEAALMQTSTANLVEATKLLSDALKGVLTEDGERWQTKLAKKHTWNDYLAAGLETYKSMNPKSVMELINAVKKSRDQFAEMAGSFGKEGDEDKCVAEALRWETVAKTEVTVGSLLAILQAQPQTDKVTLMRAVKKQLAMGKNLNLDPILLKQAQKASSI